MKKDNFRQTDKTDRQTNKNKQIRPKETVIRLGRQSDRQNRQSSFIHTVQLTLICLFDLICSRNCSCRLLSRSLSHSFLSYAHTFLPLLILIRSTQLLTHSRFYICSPDYAKNIRALNIHSHIYSFTDRNRQKERERKREIERQTDRQTLTDTDRHKQTQTNTNRHRQTQTDKH